MFEKRKRKLKEHHIRHRDEVLERYTKPLTEYQAPWEKYLRKK